MPITTIEMIIIFVNDTFKADPSLFDSLRAGAQKAGIVNQSYGFQVEDPNQLYWILHFDQGFEPKDFVWPTSEYGDFAQEVSRISTKVSSTFLRGEAFTKGITTAPVTEVASLTLSDDAKIQDFNASLRIVETNLVSKEPTMHNITWAVNSSNERQVHLFLGWDSTEAHFKYQKTPEYTQFRDAVGSYLNFAIPPSAVHVKFTDNQ